MAILIPSKNIYNKQNPKVRDNVIERIEVGAIEIVPNNEYETPVFNKDIEQFSSYYNAIERYDFGEGYHTPEDATENDEWSETGVAYCKISTRYSSQDISFNKVKNNKFISSIKSGDINVSVYYKYKLYREEGYFDENTNVYYSTKRVLQQEKDLGIIDLSEKEEKEKTILVAKAYIELGNTYQGDYEAIVSIEAKDESKISSSQIKEEGDYFIGNGINILCGVNKVSVEGSRRGTLSQKSTIVVYGDYEEYIPQKISITVYGNTIGIDLTDKTLHINGETQKKVHSVEGNELMQTSNYLLDSGKKAIETMYSQTREEYENGKETATIRCSISDYYGYGDGGAKEISIDNSTKKMTFDIGDKVVPMVYGADGQDRPMSLEKLGEPKVFEVLGAEKEYDGAVWQTLHLQEIKAKNYTARIREGALFNDGNGFSFIVIGSGGIYMKQQEGRFTLVAQVNSPTQEVRVDIRRSEYVDWAFLEEVVPVANPTAYYIATFEFRGNFKKISYADTKEIAGGSGRYATLIEVLSYNSLLSSTYDGQFSYGSINALKNLPKDITTLARRTAYDAKNPTEILEIPRTIKKISEEAFSQSDITRVKFLHNDNDYIELPKAGSGTGMFYNKNAVSMTIYTDNLTIKNYDWATDNITPTFLHIDGTAWE